MSGGGDYTRFTFDPLEDHSGVLMQQGRVMLDADFNELVALLDRRLRAETIDIIGRCTVPRETPEGFQIFLSGGALTIGRGRLYADGLLAENHGIGTFEYDASLGERRRADRVPYEAQPWFPNVAVEAPLPKSGGPFLVYADVWQREVTHLEEPDLLEKALGVDTATRLQTVWQVKLFDPRGAPDLTCATPDDAIPGWLDVIAPSAGRLTTAAAGVPASDDPCTIPPNAGFRGNENRLYRVEVHDPGAAGTATFKWSRDNASVATMMTGLNAARTKLTVVRTGRDAVLRFSTGDWVEVSDDRHELNGRPGRMRKVLVVDDVAETITLADPLPAGEFDPGDASRHTRVRRWDQKALVTDANGNVIEDVDAGPLDAGRGVITVPSTTTTIVLEDGVHVTFSSAPAGGRFHVGDHWAFAARTADASVEILDEAPPRGVIHHFCRLAVVTFPDDAVSCRTLWPPEGGEAGCDCSACVTAESHNSAQFTIQMALDRVRDTGGKVCLGPGLYHLQSPLEISGGRSVHLQGRGWTTMLQYLGGGPAVGITNALNVTVDDLAVTVAPISPRIGVAGAPGVTATTGMGFLVHNSVAVTIQRCAVVQAGRRSEPTGFNGPLDRLVQPGGPAIALSGFLVETRLRENVLLAGSGVEAITSRSAPTGINVDDPGDTSLLSLDLTIEDNVIVAASKGIALEGLSRLLVDTRLARNRIAVCPDGGIRVGARSVGDVPLPSRLDVLQNLVFGSHVAILLSGVNDARVEANDIVAPAGDTAATASGGITVGETNAVGLTDLALQRCLVSGNRVVGPRETGIMLAGAIASAMISGNVVDGADRGILVAFTRGDATIDRNQLMNLGPSASDGPNVAQGILAGFVARLHVAHNTIMGRPDVEYASATGIQVNASPRVHLAHNHILVGQKGPLLVGAGIHVAAVDRVDVVDNVVRRADELQPDESHWRGVLVNAKAPARAAVMATGVGAVALVPMEGGIIVVGAGPPVKLPAPNGVVSVRGNLVEALGLVPAVTVASAGPTVVSDNRCFLASSKETRVVDVEAPALIASGNYVDGQSQNPAMRLDVPKEAFTVLGNIASGDILMPQVGSGSLESPWRALNVIA